MGRDVTTGQSLAGEQAVAVLRSGVERARLEQPGIRLLKIANRGRKEALRVVWIAGRFAGLLYIKQRPRELDAHPLQLADPAG